MVSSAPVIRKPHPSLFPLTILGGMTATVLLVALIHLAPLVGLPLVDLPGLIGGVFSANAGTALTVGYVIFLTMGMVVFPLALSLLWPAFPGHDASFGGALLKGLLWGLLLWLLSGALLPVFAFFGAPATDELHAPGLFALGTGLLGPVVLLAQQLAYGLSLAAVASMGRDVSPLDTIGWMWTSHGSGEAP